MSETTRKTGLRNLAALLAPPHRDRPAAFTHTFGEIGASLRELHELRRPHACEPEGPARRPTSLTRACAWMGQAWGNERATTALVQLEARLSPPEWRAVEDAVHRVRESFGGGWGAARPVVSLGGLSLANVLVTPEDLRSGWVILFGSETCLGPASYDVGFLLGELAEHAFVYAAAGVPSDDFAALAASFLSGYGPAEDLAMVAATTVFRVLLHILDFSHFVGEIDDWYIYAELIRVLIDSPLGWIPGY